MGRESGSSIKSERNIYLVWVSLPAGYGLNVKVTGGEGYLETGKRVSGQETTIQVWRYGFNKKRAAAWIDQLRAR